MDLYYFAKFESAVATWSWDILSTTPVPEEIEINK